MNFYEARKLTSNPKWDLVAGPIYNRVVYHSEQWDDLSEGDRYLINDFDVTYKKESKDGRSQFVSPNTLIQARKAEINGTANKTKEPSYVGYGILYFVMLPFIFLWKAVKLVFRVACFLAGSLLSIIGSVASIAKGITIWLVVVALALPLIARLSGTDVTGFDYVNWEFWGSVGIVLMFHFIPDLIMLAGQFLIELSAM